MLRPTKYSAKRIELVDFNFWVEPDGVQVLQAPFHLPSSANYRGHTRDRKRTRRIAHQRGETLLFLRSKAKKPMLPGARVTLVRIAPRNLDEDDNLPISMKHIRDGVCQWLGVDDRRREVVRFIYDQWKHSQPHTYGCQIHVHPDKDRLLTGT